MIRLEEKTPNVYYKMSRDFQYIGRLYDVILNYAKTNSDTIYYLPNGNNANSEMITLLAMTLGFIPKHEYNSKQLLAICNVLSYIMRNKGSLHAVTIAVNALLNAEGIVDNLDYEYKDYMLTLYIPDELGDLTLLNDLMDYITPAGIGYDLVKEFKVTKQAITEVASEDNVTITKNDTISFSGIVTVADLEAEDSPYTTAKLTDIYNGKPLPGIRQNSSILTIKQLEDFEKLLAGVSTEKTDDDETKI